ncbi:MAG: hypothetical protein R2695_21505 [Acidimicrobiales bacterium]
MAELLDLSGPVVLDDLRIAADDVVPFLLTGQYERYAADEPGWVEALDRPEVSTFTAVTAGSLPGPRAIGDRFAPSATRGRIGAWRRRLGPRFLLEAVGA